MVVRRVLAGFLSPFSNLQKFLVALFAVVAMTATSAAPVAANPLYAAYVIDAKTGQVLFSRNGDARRFPASLTKMMTVYMIFEALESGRVSKSTRIPVSAKAAAEVPTKVGIRAGGHITVDDAIKALIVRSANDVATAAGEFLGGSESNFAKMMTAKARQLGMNSTQFRNAHGLPNSQQYTTARDMAILGIALREHFPNHYAYFSTRSFKLGSQNFNTHNRMFSRVKGVDGIKTGYIRSSGFNLVSSVQDNGRSIVAVVMGGRSGRSRDDHMAALIREHLPRASRSGSGKLIASRALTPGTPAAVASIASLPSRNIPVPAFRPASEPQAAAVQVTAYAPAEPTPRVTPPAPVPAAEVPVAFEAPDGVDPVMTASTPPSGWAVQIASSPSQNDAFAALVRAGKQASGILGSANAFLEEFDNRGTTYYRARFGFASKSQAWDACNALKKQKIDCYAAEL